MCETHSQFTDLTRYIIPKFVYAGICTCPVTDTLFDFVNYIIAKHQTPATKSPLRYAGLLSVSRRNDFSSNPIRDYFLISNHWLFVECDRFTDK